MALTSYVASASSIPVFGNEKVIYEGDWKLLLGDRARPRHTISFRFTELCGDLGEYARAFITHLHAENGMKPHAGSQYMRTFSFLSQAMERQGIKSVVDLTGRTFSTAQALVEQHGYSHHSLVEQCNRLQRIARSLVALHICSREFDWTHPHRSEQAIDVFSQEARAKEKNLLPQQQALQALAELRHAIEARLRYGDTRARFDLIIYWITIVIFATGLRANEIISSRRDFIIRKVVADDRGRTSSMYFLRRSTSKGGPSDARPLSPVAALLCRRAKKYLHVLTKSAREKLDAYLEAGDVASEWKEDKSELLSQKAVGRYLGLASSRSMQLVSKEISTDGVVHPHDLYVYLNDCQRTFLAGLPKTALTDSYYPVLTEWVGRNGRKLAGKVVRLIDYADIKRFLAGNGREVTSALERYLGQNHYLASHQFRRLMDTSIREGGISENEIAVLQGRASPAQNAPYDYRTPDERARDVKAAIRGGEGYGWTASAYWALPIDEREEFLDAVVQVAYRTPVGHCLTNITQDGCPYHLQCLSGCGDYLHVKGDPLAIDGLTKQKAWALKTLDRISEAVSSDAGLEERVQNHQSHIRRQLMTIDRVMAIEEDTAIPLGDVVRVNPDNESFSNGAA